MTDHRISQMAAEAVLAPSSQHRVSQLVVEYVATLTTDDPAGTGCEQEELIVPADWFIQAPATIWQDDPRWTHWFESPSQGSWFQDSLGAALAFIVGDRLGSRAYPANQHIAITITPADFPELAPGKLLQLRGELLWEYIASAFDLNGLSTRVRLTVNGTPLVNLPSGFPPATVTALPFTLNFQADANGEIHIEYGIYGDDGGGSLSLIAKLLTLEVWCREQVEVEPPPPPEPIAPCSPLDILIRAQEETGYTWIAFEPGFKHLERYAKQLLSRCMAAWYGNEVGDETPYYWDLMTQPGGTLSTGWGFNWGFNWGGGAGYLVRGAVPFPIVPPVEAIWALEALPTGLALESDWIQANVVHSADRTTGLPPRAMIRNSILWLLDFQRDWFNQYDAVRLRVTQQHTTASIYLSIAPNIHIGPLFCRACELEMSRHLAHSHEDNEQAARLRRELGSVTRALMDTSRSQRTLETVRATRR